MTIPGVNGKNALPWSAWAVIVVIITMSASIVLIYGPVPQRVSANDDKIKAIQVDVDSNKIRGKVNQTEVVNIKQETRDIKEDIKEIRSDQKAILTILINMNKEK